MSDATCPHCGNPFDPVSRCVTAGGVAYFRAHGKRKYCSAACARAGGPPAPPRTKGSSTAAHRARAASIAAGREPGVDPATCERQYSDEELAFLKAMDRYRREKRRPFPTFAEVLAVAKSLGYRKTV